MHGSGAEGFERWHCTGAVGLQYPAPWLCRAWPHSWCSGLQNLIPRLQGGRHSGCPPFFSCPGRQVQPLLSVMEIWASGTEIPALRSHKQHSNIGDIWVTFCTFLWEWWGQSCNFHAKPWCFTGGDAAVGHQRAERS